MLPLLPLVRATVEATAISAAANITSQLILQYRRGTPFTVQKDETLRFSAIIAIINPLLYLWHIFLERAFPARPPQHATAEMDPLLTRGGVHFSNSASSGSSEETPDVQSRADSYAGLSRFKHWKTASIGGVNVRNTLSKLLVDVFLVGSWWQTLLFLTLMALFKGMTSAELAHSIKTETLPIVLDGFKLWPAACLLAFVFIPVERRIVFFSVVNFGWFVYLSLATAEP